MRDVYRKLYQQLSGRQNVCLTTITAKTGSGPQLPGSNALFGKKGLIAGTLGGGIMEADAAEKVKQALQTKKADWYTFSLDNDISEENSAICGGKTAILIDPTPEKHLPVFRKVSDDLVAGKGGILLSHIKRRNCGSIGIDRKWYPAFQNSIPVDFPEDLPVDEVTRLFEEKKAGMAYPGEEEAYLIEPLYPAPRLIIAGAGHIGKALTHIASLLDFDITVVDDRPEYANRENLPEAGNIIVSDMSSCFGNMSIDRNTFIVIVSRGHHDDAEALKACINKPAAYIGMIGSRRKIRLMRQKFLEEKWTDDRTWDKIYAPVGIDIGSESVQEIALSIAAQLVSVKKELYGKTHSEEVHAVILAAGESRRMGSPKMLLPFGDKSIIETLISNIKKSAVNSISMVIGAVQEPLIKIAQREEIPVVTNNNYREGMLSSVISGLNNLPEKATAVMIFLGDQPMIQPGIIDELLRAKKHSGKGIVLPAFRGKRGHPLLIDLRYRNDILSLDPATGLRALLQKHPADVFEVETQHDYILRDIDTKEDYEREANKNKTRNKVLKK